MATLAELDQRRKELGETIEAAVAKYGTDWLRDFVPAFRVRDEGVEIFRPRDGRRVRADNMSYLAPEAVPVFEGAYAGKNAGAAALSFTKGAVALSTMLEADEQSRVAEFVNEALSRIEAGWTFPALDERFISTYYDLAHAVIVSGEVNSWQSQLGYCLGMLWLLGHVKNPGRVRVGGLFGKGMPDIVKEHLVSVVSRGSFEH